MTRLLISVLVIVLFSGCAEAPQPVSPPPSTAEPDCADQIAVEAVRDRICREVEAKAELTPHDAEKLIRPLAPRYKLDARNCVGFQRRVLDMTHAALKKLSPRIVEPLTLLCSQPIPEGRDTISIIGAEDQIESAKAALRYLGRPTEGCTPTGR